MQLLHMYMLLVLSMHYSDLVLLAHRDVIFFLWHAQARSDKSLHDIAVMDAAELEQVKADVDEKLEEYNKAQDDYDAFAGPSSLPKLISLRRSNGIKLPFKVNMYKGNTLALTVWPVSAEDGTASPMGGPGSRAVSPVAGEQHQQDSAVVDVKTKRNDGLTKAALDKNAKAGNASGNTVISAATMSTITTAKNKNPKKLNVDVASEMTISPRGDNEFLYFTPGKWRKLLKTGMEVKILGVPFTIVNKHHHVRDYESSVLHDEKTYASSVDVPLSRKKKGKKGVAAAAVIAEEEVLSDDGKSELSANSSIPRTPALGDPTSPGAAGLKSFEVGADDDSMNSDTDSDDDESEKGSRDGELALEKVVDTTEHIRFDRPWILDSREGLEIYKVMPKPFFSRQIYRAERYVQKTYVLQKVCAILAITAHKTGKLNKYLGHFFDEESGIGGWFRDRAKTNYSTRDFWLKRSNTVVEMSFDFSLRRQVTRATIRTLRMVRALARAGVRAVEKFRKEVSYLYIC